MTEEDPIGEDEVNLDRIHLSEYDTTDLITLSDKALDALEELNKDDGGTRIEIEHGRNEAVRLKSSAHVGTVSLPDGPEIRITPKAAGTNFLELLHWAQGSTPLTHEEQTSAATGSTIVDAFGWLYTTELDRLLTRGPHREYRWTDETKTRLRGQLDVHRQLQQQAPAATAFEVRYDELTTDTVANRGIRQAAERLSTLVRNSTLASQLQQQARRLSRWTKSTPVRAADLEAIETTRLNEHYETILRLAEQVLRHRHLDDFSRLDTMSFGLLVNMNQVFEDAVERTAREVATSRPTWRVRTQDRIPPIAVGGTPSVNMYPDFVLEEDGVPRLVGDAKWKTDTISQSDIYQMSAYMLALDVPGALIYPEHIDSDGSIETSYRVDDRHRLLARELPTAATPVKRTYSELLQDELTTVFTDAIETFH